MGRVSVAVVEGRGLSMREETEWWEDEGRGDVKGWGESASEEGTMLAAVAREGRSGSVAGSTRPRGGG